jgi:hypothetical protein
LFRLPGGEARRATDLVFSTPPLHWWRGGWGVRCVRNEKLLLGRAPYDGRAAFESKAEQPADVGTFLDTQNSAQFREMRPDRVARANRFDGAPACFSFDLGAGTEGVGLTPNDLTPQPPLISWRGGARTEYRSRSLDLSPRPFSIG